MILKHSTYQSRPKPLGEHHRFQFCGELPWDVAMVRHSTMGNEWWHDLLIFIIPILCSLHSLKSLPNECYIFDFLGLQVYYSNINRELALVYDGI